MSYVTINDFKLGLDARKMALALPPGALVVCDNAHITPGGEVEKRKKFAPYALPANTFGFQEVPNGLLVFGSTDPASIGALPAGVGYQQLKHPAVLAGSTPDLTMSLVAIVSSCLFGNAAFAVARFADGGVFCYYDGNLVADFVAGVVLAYMDTNEEIATNIVGLLAATAGYADSAQVGTTAVLNILGQPGATYRTDTHSSGAGTLTPQIKDAGLGATPGTQAAGQFQIMAGSAGGANYISSVKLYNGATLVAQLLFDYNTAPGSQTATSAGTLVAFGADVNATAIAIASSISQKAGITGFYAIASSNIISVVAAAAGTTANAYKLEVTAAGNVCVGNCVIAFSGTVAAITSIVAGSTTICGAVAAQADIPATVAFAAATVISTTAGAWCAYAIGSTLYLSKAVTTSADTDTTITVTCGTGMLTSDGGNSGWTAAAADINFTAIQTWSKAHALVSLTVTNCTTSNYVATSGAANVVINGTANPPYTYLWSFPTGVATSGFSIVNAAVAAVRVKHDFPPTPVLFPAAGGHITTKYTTTLQCVVKDAASSAYTIAAVKITFTFTLSVLNT